MGVEPAASRPYGRFSPSGGDIQRIYKANVAKIAQVHGIGQQTAIRLKVTLALAIRLHEPTGERPVINSPGGAAALVMYEMSLFEQEHFKVMLLDTRNRLLDIVEVYHGSVNSSQVRVGEIFKPTRSEMPASFQQPVQILRNDIFLSPPYFISQIL